MLMRRLLEGLFEQGVVLVTTSNQHPDDALPRRPAAQPVRAGDRADQAATSRSSTSMAASITACASWSRPASITSTADADEQLEQAFTGDRAPRIGRIAARSKSKAASSARAGTRAAWRGSTSRSCATVRAARPITSSWRGAITRCMISGIPVFGVKRGRYRAALHLAGRRVLRPAREADRVGRGAAGRISTRTREGRRPVSSAPSAA